MRCSGDRVTLQRRATKPDSCRREWTPSAIRKCVMPISWRAKEVEAVTETSQARGYLDELELQRLGQADVRLGDAEHHTDDVFGRVAQEPEVLQHLVGRVHVAPDARVQHVPDEQRVRLVAHLLSGVTFR